MSFPASLSKVSSLTSRLPGITLCCEEGLINMSHVELITYHHANNKINTNSYLLLTFAWNSILRQRNLADKATRWPYRSCKFPWEKILETETDVASSAFIEVKVLNTPSITATHPENPHVFDIAAESVRITNTLWIRRTQDRLHRVQSKEVGNSVEGMYKFNLTFLCPSRSTLCSR